MAKRNSCPSKIVRGAGKDLISDLPKNLIDLILDALPLRDAVRTSVLSRKWQYRWFTISELVFSDQFFESLSIKYLTELGAKNIINKILLLHTGHIRKFTLQTPYDLNREDDLNQWLHFLSRNGIKELTLHCSTDHQMGLELYSCLELTDLNIRNCEFYPPAAFKGFPNLIILELLGVSVNEKFGDVISVCHQLKRVSIQDCCGLHDLVLRSPKLLYLYVNEVYGLKTICLNSAVNLASLSISLSDKAFDEAFEKLWLGDNVLEAREELNTESPTQDISFVEDYGDDDCSFGELRTVMLRDLRVLKAEMALIKLLLGHSPLLEQMIILVANGVGKDKSHSMCKKLMCFARASPEVRIFCYDHFIP